MSKNTYIIIAVVVLVVLGGFLFLQSGNTPKQAASEVPISTPSENEEGQVASVTVTYTDTGYSPREVTILQGGTVIFQNESNRLMWPATAIHPTHTIYPNSDIQKCKTAQQPQMFDACEGIAQGASWSFSFTEVGSWGYHDHLEVSNTGKIIVE